MLDVHIDYMCDFLLFFVLCQNVLYCCIALIAVSTGSALYEFLLLLILLLILLSLSLLSLLLLSLVRSIPRGVIRFTVILNSAIILTDKKTKTKTQNKNKQTNKQ